MLINGLKGIDNYTEDTRLILVLDATADEVMGIDTAHVAVTTDAGDVAEEYFGYVKQSAAIDMATGYITLTCYHDTDGAGAAVTALGKKVSGMSKQNDETAAVLATLLGGE